MWRWSRARTQEFLVCPGGTENALPNEDGRILIAQIATTGSLSGTLNYQVFPLGDQNNEVVMTATFDGMGVFGQALCAGARPQEHATTTAQPISTTGLVSTVMHRMYGRRSRNFDPTATAQLDTGCDYPADGYDCDGNCLVQMRT